MKKLLFLLSLAFLCSSLRAQNDDYRLYMHSAADASVVFRGSQAVQYRFPYNGTPYWKGPDFGTGDLEYNGKMYYGLRLNIDAATQTLVLKNDSGVCEVALDGRQYETFTIDGVRFMRKGGKIYEYIWDGRAKVLKQIRKVQETDTEGRKSFQTAYDGRFNPKIPTVFTAHIKYFYVAEGSSQMEEFKSRSALLKNYKTLKKEAADAAFKASRGEKMPDDEYYRFVMQYIESR